MSITLRVRWTAARSYKQMTFSSSSTTKEVSKEVTRTQKLSSEILYWIFVPSEKGGKWLQPTDTLASAGLKDRDVIELKHQPFVVNFFVSDGTEKWLNQIKSTSSPDVALQHDYTDPISEVISTLQSQLQKQLKKDEYSFQHLSWNGSGSCTGRMLNASTSLKEQEVEETASIALVPLGVVSKRPVESIKNITKEGFLTKVSVKENKMTGTKKRYCVLVDNHLYYYQSQTASSPKGGLAIDFFDIKPDFTGGKYQFELAPSGPSFSHTKTIYIFGSDDEKTCKDWINAIRPLTASGAGKKVFGMPLHKVLARKDYPSDIPDIVSKCVSYIYHHGLDVEGIFRISAGASLIEKYKDDFNMSLDVDLSKCPDPHAVSGLLKLYLRELPEPLLTSNLYYDFLRCNEIASKEAKIQELSSLWGRLPEHSQSVLGVLLPFLKRVISHSDKNLMPSTNVATIFAPTLLKPESDDAALLVQHSSKASAIVEFLLTNQDSIIPQSRKTGTKTPIELAIALYAYTGGSQRELSFQKGDEIPIFQKLESGWLLGEMDGVSGMVPATYVKLVPYESGKAFVPAKTNFGNARRAAQVKKPAHQAGFGSRASTSVPNTSSSGNMKVPRSKPPPPLTTSPKPKPKQKPPPVPIRSYSGKGKSSPTLVQKPAPGIPKQPAPKPTAATSGGGEADTISALEEKVRMLERLLEEERRARQQLEERLKQLE